jgi:MFS family permease
MAVLDTTIVNVALPSIGAGTKASSASLEWVVSGYTLTFGLALAGLAVFTLASAARSERSAGGQQHDLRHKS